VIGPQWRTGTRVFDGREFAGTRGVDTIAGDGNVAIGIDSERVGLIIMVTRAAVAIGP